MVMYDTSQQVINTGGPGMVTPCRTSQVVQAHTGDLWGELERGGAEFQMDMENRMGMENLDHVKRGQFMEAPKDQPQQMFTVSRGVRKQAGIVLVNRYKNLISQLIWGFINSNFSHWAFTGIGSCR